MPGNESKQTFRFAHVGEWRVLFKPVVAQLRAGKMVANKFRGGSFDSRIGSTQQEHLVDERGALQSSFDSRYYVVRLHVFVQSLRTFKFVKWESVGVRT